MFGGLSSFSRYYGFFQAYEVLLNLSYVVGNYLK